MLLAITHLLPSMRGRALSTGAGELLILQLSLAGTAACWDWICGRNCQLTAFTSCNSVFVSSPHLWTLKLLH